MKTGVMTAENAALPSGKKNDILKYSQMEHSYLTCNNNSLYFCFHCIFKGWSDLLNDSV